MYTINRQCVYPCQRGGTRKQRPIPVFTGHRPSPFLEQMRPLSSLNVNKSNLINIKPISTTKTNFTFDLLKARSINNKQVLIHDLIFEKQCDVLFITETWLNINNSKRLIAPRGYKCFQCDRQTTRRWNNGHLKREHKPSTSENYRQPQHIWNVGSNHQTRHYTLYNFLRIQTTAFESKPTQNIHFLTEFENFLSGIHARLENFLVIGNFNIHVNDKKWSHGQSFPNNFGLVQLKTARKCTNIRCWSHIGLSHIKWRWHQPFFSHRRGLLHIRPKLCLHGYSPQQTWTT